jgi:hypothetical protein
MDTDTKVIKKIIIQAQQDPEHLQRIVKMALSEYDKHMPPCGIDSGTFLEHCNVIADVKKAIPMFTEIKETLIKVESNQEQFKTVLKELKEGREQNASDIKDVVKRVDKGETSICVAIWLIGIFGTILVAIATLAVFFHDRVPHQDPQGDNALIASNKQIAEVGR